MIVEYHELEIINDRVIQEVVSYLEPSWLQHYFLLLGLYTKRHIEEIIIDKRDGDYDWLLAIRSSKKAHFSSRFSSNELENVYELLKLIKLHKIKSLLCYELELIKLSELFDTFTYEKTSYVMTRACNLISCNEEQEKHKLRPDFDCYTLSAIDLNEVVNLYKSFMPGSISEQDMIKLHQLGAKAYGIRHDKHLIAVAQVGLSSPKEAYVFGVLTVPDMRRKGLSMDLMRLIVAQADKMGITLHLLTNNPSAIELYKKLDFEIKGSMYEIKFDYKEILW